MIPASPFLLLLLLLLIFLLLLLLPFLLPLISPNDIGKLCGALLRLTIAANFTFVLEQSASYDEEAGIHQRNRPAKNELCMFRTVGFQGLGLDVECSQVDAAVICKTRRLAQDRTIWVEPSLPAVELLGAVNRVEISCYYMGIQG